MCDLYRGFGIDLGELRPATAGAKGEARQELAGQIVLAPPGAIADRWARRLPDPVVCMASGWMRVKQRAKQRGVELPLVDLRPRRLGRAHRHHDLDLNARHANFRAQGAATARGEPILNPVTKAEFRGGIVLPNGMEYGQSEVGRGWSESSGAVAITLEDSHAHWAELHMNQHGRIH